MNAVNENSAENNEGLNLTGNSVKQTSGSLRNRLLSALNPFPSIGNDPSSIVDTLNDMRDSFNRAFSWVSWEEKTSLPTASNDNSINSERRDVV